jgi:hypothetical protein
MLANPPSVPIWDSVGLSPLLCSFVIGAGTPWGTCECTEKLVDPSNFGGAWRFEESPQSPSSNRRRAGAGSRSSRNAALFSFLGAFRPLGRGAPSWSARASCCPWPRVSPGVRSGVPLGLLSHSGRRFNVGPVARAVNPGGAPSAARNGEFRSRSGRLPVVVVLEPPVGPSQLDRSLVGWASPGGRSLLGTVETSPGQS